MNHFFHYCMTGILVLFYSLAVLVSSCQSATNLALGKSYTVAPLPSYPLSAPPTDTTSLSDGKYSIGYFWAQKTTVGWHAVPSVEILIDLEKLAVIEGITFNTARGDSAEVFYPLQIHVFVGPDKEHFTYYGDMADQPKNISGTYQVTKFELSGINVKGRYVLLEVTAPSSQYVFCDEIEVLEGQIDSGVIGNYGIVTVRNLMGVLKWNGVEQKLLRVFLEHPVTTPNGLNKLVAQINETGQSEPKLATPINIDNLIGQPANLQSVNTLSLSVRADTLHKEFPQDKLLVESINPWESHSPFAPVSGQSLNRVSLVAPVGGYDNAAFVITNIGPEVQKIDVTLTNVSGDTATMFLYQAPFVRSAALEYVPDPLVPASEIVLQPGESRVMFIAAHGNAPGVLNCSLNIEGQVAFPTVPVTVTVPNITLPSRLALNAVNWGYLGFPLIQDRMQQAVEDLQRHHTNVVVVPPGYLQGANQLMTVTLQDFKTLETYLKYHHGASKVLLFLLFGPADQKTVSAKIPFLSDEWKDNFKKWYADAILAAGRAGFAAKQVYLYPYDEMGGEQIDDFVRLAQWAKQEIPAVQFYATFGEATLKSNQWGEALPYLDIVQSYDEKMFIGRDQRKTEAWIYNTGRISRSLSPYSYYRLMSWKAFLKGYRGVGFWAYADTGKDTTAWKELERDFAVIYDGENQSIVSSRRWEAWRMGIEDYELLTMYAKTKGDGAAKALAQDVFDNPKDTSRADNVRRKLLLELSDNQRSPPIIKRIMKK